MKFYAYINSSDSLSEICTQKFFTAGELFSLSHNVAPDLVNPSDLLILNIDPFSLFSFNVSVIEKVNCPKVAIICDTHHGILPLSRSIAFCLRLSIKTVILRFNQRHKSWFESFGISCYCTLLSPDLFNYINNHGFISPFSQPDRTNKLLSVGRLSPAHKYRYQILSNISQDSELTSAIDHKNTTTFSEMIDLLSRYSFSFNASLNLDFNRRLIESTIAGTICISDSLESLQFSGFFEIFKESILWYDDINQLKNIINCRSSHLEKYSTALLQLQSNINRHISSLIDQNLRTSCVDESILSFHNKTDYDSVSSFRNTFFSLFEYELSLLYSQNLDYSKSISCLSNVNSRLTLTPLMNILALRS